MRYLVTGANRGLGLEFARQLTARGDRVFATCRDPEAAEDLRAIQTVHPDLLTITAMNITDPASIAASYEAISQQTDALDVLINNAGINPSSEKLGQLDKDNLLRAYEVNAVGPMLVLQQYLELVKAGEQPKVINLTTGISSISGRDKGEMYAYVASKAALNMLMRTSHIELKDWHIATIVMDPGWVKTDMGGPNAWITPDESISGMLKVIDGLTLDNSGKFYHYSGSEIAW